MEQAVPDKSVSLQLFFLAFYLSIPPTRKRVMLKVWWSLGNQSL
jgi:hypothetical protein